jgi:hypothetical protein
MSYEAWANAARSYWFSIHSVPSITDAADTMCQLLLVQQTHLCASYYWCSSHSSVWGVTDAADTLICQQLLMR